MDQKEKNLNNYHSSYLRIFLYISKKHKNNLYIIFEKKLIISKTDEFTTIL
jgi:hypothetical protein